MVGFQLISSRALVDKNKSVLSLLGDHRSIEEKKLVREQNDKFNVMKNWCRMFDNKERKKYKYTVLVISGCIFQPQKMNIAVETFFSNVLDFSQFTVDSSENNTENS